MAEQQQPHANIKAKGGDIPVDLESKEYSDEEFAEMLRLYDETLKGIAEGEIVKGEVVAIDKDSVIVDIGFKSEGEIPLSEFGEPPLVKVGDEIDVFLENVEDQDGQLVISKQKADFLRVWDQIKSVYENNETVEGELIRRVKGGIIVDLFGVEAFLPGSQIDVKLVKNFDQFIGKKFPLKVIKVNKSRRKGVVSCQAVLEEEQERRRQELLAQLKQGDVREGLVKNITDFGVFIDLGGVDGLLHITDMSWGRVSHPSELVAIGDRINVKILNYDQERKRVSLGLKQLTPPPWESVEDKYPIGQKVRGKIVSITSYGAFIQLEEGVEGLIHISEMSWTQHIRHPSQMVAIGDIVEAVVLDINKEEKKISLSLKQVEPDPWLSIEERYPVGARVTGKVRSLTNFGAFIEIEDGIDGLLHISDMSWTKKVRHPSELVKKGSKVEVVVLKVDKANRRISLGLKQLTPDPWDGLALRFAPGTVTEGKITQLLDSGAVVELEGDVEGFVPASQLGQPELKKPSDGFNVRDILPLKVIEFDKERKKIVLSVEEYLKEREKEEIEEYKRKHAPRPVTIADMVSESHELKTERGEAGSEPEETVQQPAVEVNLESSSEGETTPAGTEAEKTEELSENKEQEESPRKRGSRRKAASAEAKATIESPQNEGQLKPPVEEDHPSYETGTDKDGECGEEKQQKSAKKRSRKRKETEEE